MNRGIPLQKGYCRSLVSLSEKTVHIFASELGCHACAIYTNTEEATLAYVPFFYYIFILF